MSPLPAGTVTFVFTDIEGSTRLFRQLGPRYPVLLEHHRRLLRKAITDCGGVEVKTEGDAFFVAFARARDALAACLQAQLALASFRWPEGGEIRVRMGMHTGEATPEDGDYVAMAVHQAARVAAAGHGGQVLVSEATYQLLLGAHPDVSFIAIGDFRLKDFDDPQPLYQLAHPQLRRDFPALKVLPAAGHNLPLQRTAFIGREAELKSLAPVLNQGSLVTITGPGGSGKTRLAVELATRSFSDYPDGVWLVELASLVDADLVDASVAASLGVREEPGRTLIETLIDTLRPRRLLLVLDNCEHVVARCAELADALLSVNPGLKILATSREPLAVDGERSWIVPPLGLPDPGAELLPQALTQHDGVRLFLDRAVAARNDFALTSANASAVVEICRRLDGIPLAIELAAARTALLEPAEIVHRLNDRFGLLIRRTRSTLPHHQTLRATVEWSHNLLAGPERVLFRRLSVFANSYTLAAAEEICCGGQDADWVLETLAQLVAKSLVQTVRSNEGSRYRLLETIREYGAEKLAEAGEATMVGALHAQYFTSVVEEVTPHVMGSSLQRSLDRLEAEHDEYRAALTWLLESRDVEGATRLAGALWPFWNHAYYAREGRSWMRRVLALHGASPACRLRALVGSAHLAFLEEDLDAVARAYTEAAAMDGGVEVQRSKAMLKVSYAEVLRMREHGSERADALCVEAVELFAGIGDQLGEADATRVLTLLAWDRGDLDRATAAAERCLEVSSAVGNLSNSAGAASMLAGLARERGDLDCAQRLYEQSLADLTEAREPQGTAHIIRSLATLAFDQGDADRALSFGEEALTRYERLGHPRGIPESLKAIADACYLAGDLDRAERLAGDALRRFREQEFAADLVSALHSSARIAFARRNLERAAALAEEALVSYRSQGHTRDAGPILCLLARVRARQGHSQEALLVADEARTVFEHAGDRRGQADALEVWAEAAIAAGDASGAARALTEASVARRVAGVNRSAVAAADHRKVVGAVRAALAAAGDAAAREWDPDVIELRETAVSASSDLAARRHHEDQ